MQDLVGGFLAAPLAVQAVLVCFALAFLAMVFARPLAHRRARERFAALAASMGAPVAPGRSPLEASFGAVCEGRRFEVRRELRSGIAGSHYRGPRGNLVVLETPLSGSRWEMHGVEIVPGGPRKRPGARALETGDPDFDARFAVWQDGVPVREGWLDAPTRAAVTAFFDGPGVAGPVWAQEGRLTYVAVPPARLDEPKLTAILRRQADLASALERTAGWRGPAA